MTRAAFPLPFGHLLVRRAVQRDCVADDPGGRGGMGPYGEYVPGFCIFAFHFSMVGPYFLHSWPSPANLEAVVTHGLVVDVVDDNGAAGTCQSGS